METFTHIFGFVAAVCLGVMILTLFFNGISYLKNHTSGFEVVTMKGFIKDGRLVNIHLSNGTVYRGVRFVGFTDQSSANKSVPYPLAQMVVCETVNGARVLFRPEAVRIIEETEKDG